MGDIVLRSSRGRPLNAPAAFIHPCRPIVATQPPTGPGWAHELKHDGYRLQIHVRDGLVRLYTMNGNNWTDRYPRIVEEAIRITMNSKFVQACQGSRSGSSSRNQSVQSGRDFSHA
jgi:ATP-dependent DNA ligase